MMRTFPLLLLLALLGAKEEPAPKPLPRAHAHNDYEHARPLLDALAHGFCNVEADVHLVAGRLLVGHDPRDLRPQRTLESLYLDPLKRRIAANGGRVYRDGPATFMLMIDVKSDAASSYAALRDLLNGYQPMLTLFRDGKVEPGAVTIVISGNRDRATMAAEAVRYAALDGRLQDLDADPSPPVALVPWVSGAWDKTFKWKGEGPLSDADAKSLRRLVDKAHAQKRLIRFWAISDNAAAWKVLTDAGVDLINTDDLPGLARFMNAE